MVSDRPPIAVSSAAQVIARLPNDALQLTKRSGRYRL
jgi:hypothetical protein